MKRLFCLLIILISSRVCTFGQQRLAILPMLENIVLSLDKQSVDLATICIDGSLPPPGEELYNQVLLKGAEEILINGEPYYNGLHGLINDGIVEIETDGYLNVKFKLHSNATFKGQKVVSISYRQVTPTSIGNQSHKVEGIVTGLIFENFDFTGLSQADIQDRFWTLEYGINNVKKSGKLVFDEAGKLSYETKQLLYLVEKLGSNEAPIDLINRLADDFGIQPNATLDEKVQQLLAISNDIEEAINNQPSVGSIVKSVTESRYGNYVGVIIDVNGKKQFIEIAKNPYGNKFLFPKCVELPDVPTGHLEKVGNRYFYNGSIIMDAVDLPDFLLTDIRSRIGSGHEVSINFSSRIGSYDNVKATINSMSIMHEFEITEYQFKNMLANERFNIDRARVAETQRGFLITIPKVVTSTTGNLSIKVRNVLQSSYNSARNKIQSIIRRFRGTQNAMDLINDLAKELNLLKQSTGIDVIVELADRRVTKSNKNIKDDSDRTLAIANH